MVNQWPRQELRRVLAQYGEERYAAAIAAAIERARAAGPIETTGALVEIIRGALPAAALREKQHPAKRSFQGIRIAVNDELTAISRMLQAAIPRLKTGGRLAVISFHSLEDRIVKSELAAAAKGCDCPPSFPGVRLRQTASGPAGEPEAHPAQPGRTGGESPGPERQTARGGEAGRVNPRKSTR